ncbi:helix-turn-helix domain-containing protein, partial [Patulibacter sp. S7RM1-6]
AAVTAFLAARTPAADPAYALVRAVVGDMLGRPPDTRIGALARDHGVSERTLQRLFRELVGVSPGWVLRRHRLHEATERIGADPGQDLAALAYALGYADQAHLTGDFRAQVGVTPAAYARACRAARGA